MGLMTVMLHDIEYFVHLKYDGYGSDAKGNVKNIYTNRKPKQSVHIFDDELQLIIFIPHRGGKMRLLKKNFVFECLHGFEIGQNDKIRNINGICSDLQIANLELV